MRIRRVDRSIAAYVNGLLSYIQGYYRKMVKMNLLQIEFEQLLISLSRILSYLNSKNTYSYISEELQFINEYMKIQKLRFDRIQYEENIESRIYERSIRRFVIFFYLEEIITSHFNSCNEPLRITLDSPDDQKIKISRIVGSGIETISHVRVKKKKYEMIYNIRR